MRYGYIEGLQELTAYILGKTAVPYIYYNESGDWGSSLPKFEKQRTRDNSETSACTVYGSINQIETFTKFVYGHEPNYSERFTAILCGLNGQGGQDPQVAHENIRKNGLIEESDLRTGTTLKDFFDKTDITGSLLAKGQNWLMKHDYQHEWLWESNKRPDNYIEVLRDALKTSPLAVSVSAWNEVNGVYVSNQGSVNNHYCLLYKIDEEGYPWVFDTYDYSRKKLAKDHNIRRAKRIWLGEKTRRSMRRHISLLTLLLNTLMQRQTLLKVCENALGTDASPADTAPDSLSCADTITTLMRIVRPETPHLLSTILFNQWLQNKNNGYRLVDETEGFLPEDIIISPTQGAVTGHVGIFMQEGLIASSNSFGLHKGKFTQNYTFPTWSNYFKVKRNLPIYIYRKIT